MAYYQDEYDKWFIKAVNYALATKDKHKVFKNQIEFAEMLGFAPATLSAIKNGMRGVPKEMRDVINTKMLHLFNLSPGRVTATELKEPAAVYGMPQPVGLYETINMLKENNGYLKSLLEQYLKDIKVNSDTTLVNQQIMMAHISADSTLAAVRYVGDDPERLSAELRKRDKLIGVALEKAS